MVALYGDGKPTPKGQDAQSNTKKDLPMLRFSINKATILPILKRAKDATPRKSSRPIMMHVLLKAQGSTLFVVGSNDDSSYKSTQDGAQIMQDGAITAPAVDLLQVVNSLPAGQIDFSFDEERSELVIRSGEAIEFRLLTLSAEDYPDAETMGDGQVDTAKVPRATLLEMIDGCLFGVSNDDARYYLGGIYFCFQEGLAVATDGHRLAMSNGHPVVDLPNLLIGQHALQQMREMLSTTAQETVEISASKKKVRLSLPNQTFTSMLVEGNFPDYRLVIPKKATQRWVAPRSLLADALKRVALLSPEKTGAVRFVASESYGTLTISSSHTGRGQSKESVRVEGITEDFEIGMQSAYVLDPLQHLHTAEVSVEITNYLSPLKITPIHPPKEDDSPQTSAIHVVMPMRL